MKAYTDIEQSRKLAEILPIESADMWWSKNFIYYNPTATIGISAEYSNVYTYKFGKDDIPCWSLAALVGIFPPSYDDGQHFFALINNNLYGYTEWLCCYEASNGNTLNECYADNPIDACYNMVLKLKEKDLL